MAIRHPGGPLISRPKSKNEFGCARQYQTDPNLPYFGWTATNYLASNPGCDNGSGVALITDTTCCNWDTVVGLPKLGPGYQAPLIWEKGPKVRFGCAQEYQGDPNLPYYGWYAYNYDPTADGCDNGNGFAVASNTDCCMWDIIVGNPKLAPGTQAPLAPTEGGKTRLGCAQEYNNDPNSPQYGCYHTPYFQGLFPYNNPMYYSPLNDGCPNAAGYPVASNIDCCECDAGLGVPKLDPNYTTEHQIRDKKKHAKKPGCAQEQCNDPNSPNYGCYHKPFYGLNAWPYDNPLFYHPSNDGCPNAVGFPQYGNIDCCECDTPLGKVGNNYHPPLQLDTGKWAYGCAQEHQGDPSLPYYGWYATNYSPNYPGCDDGTGYASPTNTDCCDWDIIVGSPRLSVDGTKTAPHGYHFAVDGSIVSNADHIKNEINKKMGANNTKEAFINTFSIDTGNIPIVGGKRSFTVIGDDEAAFTIEVKDDAGLYYNFFTETWSSTASRSNRKKIGPGSYEGFINFSEEAKRSVVTYTIRLFAENTDCAETKIKLGSEVRNADGSLNKNLSGALNERLIEKEILQEASKTVSLSCIAPRASDSGEVWDGATPSASDATGAAAIRFKETEADGKIPFTISIVAASGKSIAINRQPTEDDFVMTKSINIGSSPELIPGENIYPTITTAADSTSEGGTTVNGASTGTTVTTHVASATIATVGDRVLGNAALAAATVTVETVSGGNTFTISEAISIADDLPLSFSNHVQYRWPVSDVAGLSEGMILDPSSTRGSNVTAATEIASYLVNGSYDVIGSSNCEVEQETITYKDTFVSGVVATGPVLAMNSGGVVTQQAGTLTFNKQQVDALKSDTGLYVYGYGPENITALSYGTVVSFSDLKAEILAENVVQTTTTSDTSGSASTTIGVSEQDGILDDTSMLSGVGIGGDVLVTNKAAASGHGIITVESAKAIQSGAVLTFKGAAKTITVTGYVQLSGQLPESKTIYLDVERFLTCA
jgi:hypothetical protein